MDGYYPEKYYLIKEVYTPKAEYATVLEETTCYLGTGGVGEVAQKPSPCFIRFHGYARKGDAMRYARKSVSEYDTYPSAKHYNFTAAVEEFCLG